MTNITQDEHGTITISLPDAGLEAHMSPEAFDVLARQEVSETRQRVYGDVEPVTMTREQIAYMIQGGVKPLSAETKLRLTGGLWRAETPEPVPRLVHTPNQRKRCRKRMNRG